MSNNLKWGHGELSLYVLGIFILLIEGVFLRENKVYSFIPIFCLLFCILFNNYLYTLIALEVLTVFYILKSKGRFSLVLSFFSILTVSLLFFSFMYFYENSEVPFGTLGNGPLEFFNKISYLGNIYKAYTITLLLRWVLLLSENLEDEIEALIPASWIVIFYLLEPFREIGSFKGPAELLSLVIALSFFLWVKKRGTVSFFYNLKSMLLLVFYVGGIFSREEVINFFIFIVGARVALDFLTLKNLSVDSFEKSKFAFGPFVLTLLLMLLEIKSNSLGSLLSISFVSLTAFIHKEELKKASCY